MKQAAAQPGHRLAVFGGDFFAQTSGLEEKLQGKTAFRILHLMPYDAIGLGETDFLYGADYLAPLLKGLPVVTTNLVWADTHAPLGESMIIKHYAGLPVSGMPGRTLRVAVLALVDDRQQTNLDFYQQNDKRKIQILPTVQTAREWVAKARQQADVVVGVVHMNTTDLAAFATKVPDFDILVAGHTIEELINPPKRQGKSWIVSNGDRARYVAELRFDLNRGLQLGEPVPQQIPLDSKLNMDSTSARYIQEFKTTLEAERAKQPAPKTTSEAGTDWASGEVCAACHKGIADQWKTTPHARAFATLAKTHDQDRKECLKCHVVGLGTSGGYNPDSPQGALANVQCESCHGSGVRHVMAAPADKKRTIIGHPTGQVCAGCHIPERSPNFTFNTYWPRIKH